MQRIVVVGTSGSGKTTLAGELAKRLNIPHVELDSIHWGPDWTPRPDFIERAQVALSGDSWVVDGNYSRLRDWSWRRADTVVWLDYPLWLILWRLTRRTARRVFGREELWAGNRETVDKVFSRDSIFVWVLQTYPRRKREYPQLLKEPAFAHLTAVHLCSPRETERWLSALHPDK